MLKRPFASVVLVAVCMALVGCAQVLQFDAQPQAAAPPAPPAPPPKVAFGAPPPPGGAASITASGLVVLVGHEREPEGCGLYSYLLLSNNTNDAINTYRKALFYLSKWMDSVSNLTAYGTPKSRINCTMILTADETRSPDKLTDKDIDRLSQSPNIARSQAILTMIGGRSSAGRGPYIISYRKPLTTAPTEPGQVLVVDLSDMSDDHQIEAHVVGLTWQVQKPRYWDQPALMAAYQQIDKQVRRLSLALDGVIGGIKVYKEDVKALKGG